MGPEKMETILLTGSNKHKIFISIYINNMFLEFHISFEIKKQCKVSERKNKVLLIHYYFFLIKTIFILLYIFQINENGGDAGFL